jgi:hypothetical protein
MVTRKNAIERTPIFDLGAGDARAPYGLIRGFAKHRFLPFSLLAHHEIGGTGKIGRDRGEADMAEPAVGSLRSRLTQAV